MQIRIGTPEINVNAKAQAGFRVELCGPPRAPPQPDFAVNAHQFSAADPMVAPTMRPLASFRTPLMLTALGAT